MISPQLEEQIDSYESALVAGKASLDDLAEFLPPQDSNDFQPVLVELLRITLEHQWQPGQSGIVDAWRGRFAPWLSSAEQLAPLAFEEYRLRAADGQGVDKREYATRYGIDVAEWPEFDFEPTAPDDFDGAPCEQDASWIDFSRGAPEDAARMLAARRELPAVGERFGAFELLAVLGQGAFGKVYLARQTSLAGRLVALKITGDTAAEARHLARLQHTNIVPIHSLHGQPPWIAICMPFLGQLTFADLLSRLPHGRLPEGDAAALCSTIAARRAEFSTWLTDDARPAPSNAERQPAAASERTLAALAARPLTDALLWLLTRVAAGLAHAHERGIVHQDLKPANILVSDEGEPLLLDFNLSASTAPHQAHRARLGGTLPYMAPEQLARFAGDPADVSPATDVYSFGVILFETFARESLFPNHRGVLDEVLRAMRQDRLELTSQELRRRLKPLPPGIVAIISRCLDVDPRCRYRNATELHEDLERQLTDRPLRHAPNTSWAERLRKWSRRHPRLSSWSTVAVLAVAVALGVGSMWQIRERRYQEQAAVVQLASFHASLPEARSLLTLANTHNGLIETALKAATESLDLYAVDETSAWYARPPVASLPAESRRELADQLEELLAGRVRVAALGSDPNAAAKYQRALDQFRAARHLGAPAPTEPAAEPVVEMVAARSFQVATLLHQSRAAEALRVAETLVRQQPRDASAWILLGACQLETGDLPAADASLTGAVALASDLHGTWFWRGMVRAAQRRFAAAADDFTEAIKVRPDAAAAWFNRGLARHQLKRFEEACSDFSAAEDRGFDEASVRFARSRCLAGQGLAAAADQDRRRALEAPPGTLYAWIERGVARLAADPEAAEADFRQATQIAPRSREAWINLAHVQSERLARPGDAALSLSRWLEIEPADALARSSRAVLYGRIGDNESARNDATQAALTSLEADVLYRCACAHAQMSVSEPANRNDALRYLSRALVLNPDLARLAREDADLKPLHGHPAWKQLLMVRPNPTAN